MSQDSSSATSNMCPRIEAEATEAIAIEEEAIHISASAYLRSMWTILVSCLFSPNTTTVVDLTTGKVVREE